MKLSDEYNALINKISTNIVAKSKKCQTVAEELKSFNVKLCKRNLTRWNSTLFMIRSVLKLSQTDLSSIRNNLPTNSKRQKEVKKNFGISDRERAMLEELKQILEMFEFVTDEIQGNTVSISRVYPCINYLKNALTNEGGLVYTDKLRRDLLNSLEERFKDCDENEIFLFSTFLDPNFGISAFSDEKKLILKSKLITYLKLEALKQQVKNVQLNKQALKFTLVNQKDLKIIFIMIIINRVMKMMALNVILKSI